MRGGEWGVENAVRRTALPSEQESWMNGWMKCLTICQPWAHLIIHGVGPGSELFGTEHQFKSVENRTWQCLHRGPLAIHAGKSRDWMDPFPLKLYDVDVNQLVFGGVIGAAEMIVCETCVRIGSNPWADKWGYGFVLRAPRAMSEPLMVAGKQGLFELESSRIVPRLGPVLVAGEKGAKAHGPEARAAGESRGRDGRLFGPLGGRIL